MDIKDSFFDGLGLRNTQNSNRPRCYEEIRGAQGAEKGIWRACGR